MLNLKSEVQHHWGSIQEILSSENASVLLITHLPHIQWTCGFTGSNGFLIVRENEIHLITDHRYDTQAQLEVSNATIHIGSHNLIDCAISNGLIQTSDQLLFQPEYMTYGEFNQWSKTKTEIKLLPRKNLMNLLVAAKSETAIAGMRRSQSISDAVFKVILQHITVGMTENELAAMIDYQHRLNGASKMAFETIVAFGENSALPHARPTDRRLQHDEPILLDFGGIFNGYASDMTRTLFQGSPSEEFRSAYKSVQMAQNQAVKTTSNKVLASEIDRAARLSLESSGLEKLFIHSTGHGIGLEVHEWPSISSKSNAQLLKGYTVTIEPGVYLPQQFGIRIEDTVVVGLNNCERLSSISRELITV